MRLLPVLLAFSVAACAQKPFTLQQVLSAPYSTSLTAAPTGNLFAWVEDAEGRHNLFVGGAGSPARQLTHNTEDDAQDITSLAWSPDATSIAYVYGAATGNSGKPANPAHLQRSTAVEMLLQPVAGGDPVHLGEGRAPLFTPDGSSLLFVRAGQIFITCVKDCPAAATKNAAHPLVVDRGSPGQLTLSPDGTKLAYISTRRGNGTSHRFLAVFDLTTHVLSFPAPSTGNDFAPIFSRDGKHLAWLRFPFTDEAEFVNSRTSENPWSIQALDIATGAAHTVFTTEAGKPGSVEPRLATGSPHLYVTASGQILFFSEADDWVHVYSVDPSGTKQPELLTPGDYEVEDAVLNPQGTELVYASNDTRNKALDVDLRHLWKVDLTKVSAKPEQLSHTAIETHPQVSVDGTIAALVSSAKYPMSAALILPGGPRSLHDPSNVPSDYPASSLVTPQQVIFPSSDKLLQLHGQLFLPTTPMPASGKRPAILFFHGGPKRQMLLGFPAMDYYSNAYAMNQYLASRGFIVLSVNYRCGIGYGLDFRQCQQAGADGASEYNDALGAAAYIRSRPDVDVKRVGIWGGSYGGYFTALALARNSNLFAAGVDFHGVHDWILEENRDDWLRGTNAEKDAIAAKARASSPIADIGKWKSPVLLIHGDDDPEVTYVQTPMLADALRAHHVPVEELIFPDEVHGFLLHKDWLAAYEAEAAFFERTLMPAPAK